MDIEGKVRECSGWCWPLYIYIIISVIQLLFVLTMKVRDRKTKKYELLPVRTRYKYAICLLSWNLFIGVLLYYLCKTCHAGWAWFILLLPIILNLIFFIILAIIMIYLVSTGKELVKDVAAVATKTGIQKIVSTVADRLRPSSVERHDHRCGPFFNDAKCDPGRCCSQFGWCGTGSEYCGEGVHGDGEYAWHTLV